jgi:hypothetical protein
MLARAEVSLVGKVAPKTRPEDPDAAAVVFAHENTSFHASQRSLDQASTEVEVVDGNKIVHYIWGDGEQRVLLVHGWSVTPGT